MDAFLQFSGQEEGGGPDNLEKESFPVTPPGQSFRKATLSPSASVTFVLTPLGASNKAELGGRDGKRERRKGGRLKTSDTLTVSSLC